MHLKPTILDSAKRCTGWCTVRKKARGDAGIRTRDVGFAIGPNLYRTAKIYVFSAITATAVDAESGRIAAKRVYRVYRQ